MAKIKEFTGLRYAMRPAMNSHMSDAAGRGVRCRCMLQFRLPGGRLGPGVTKAHGRKRHDARDKAWRAMARVEKGRAC